MMILFVFNNLLTWICLMNKLKNKSISVDLRQILSNFYTKILHKYSHSIKNKKIKYKKYQF